MVLIKCLAVWLLFISMCQISGLEEEDPSQRSGMSGYGVWYSSQDLLDFFNNCEYNRLPGVRAVVSTYQDFLRDPPYNLSDPPLARRSPFIAVEGTHRDSRIIVGKELTNYMQGTYLGNPPRSMVPLRTLFDREKGEIRKAFFSLCMYVGAHHVRETWTQEPVITTGYWLDQAAFSIAQRFTLDTLPPPDSPLYLWPEDLLRPDVVFFLNIPQLKWGGDRTPNIFRPKYIEVYRRIKGVKVIEINSTGTYRKIFSIIQSHLGKMFLKKMGREEADRPRQRHQEDYDYANHENR